MKQKVLLGLSGGVDSAVAALLLKKQGYEVIGAFMRCFSEKNKITKTLHLNRDFWDAQSARTHFDITKECTYLEDKKDAQRIAAQLNIKFIELDYEKEYKSQVLNKMFKAYVEGVTPNPDAQCNIKIKFPFLWKEAKKRECNFIATGHYAKKIKMQQIRRNRTKLRPILKNQKEYLYYLKIPKDKNKDQTYFLYGLTQKDLEHTLFPIGDYTKSKVRHIAKKHKLHNWNKHGTRGLCFVGNIDFKHFLKQKIKNKPGKVLSADKKLIGTHQSLEFYTIGERIKDQDIQINKEYRNKVKSKLYVAKKDKKTNTIIVAPKKHPLLFKSQFQIININLINKVNFPLNNIKVRIRHLGELIPAQITKNKNKIICTLKNPTQGIAEGQSAVIYTNQGTLLCGGEIRY